MSVSFFTLPVEVFQGPILSFLTPLCLSNLDCAVVGKSQRKELLGYFAHAVVTNEEDGHVIELNPCSLRWIQKRHLYFTNASMEANFTHKQCDAISSIVAKVTRLAYCGFDSFSSEDILKVVSSCQQLRSITMDCNEEVTDRVVETITAQHLQLKELSINSCDDLTNNALSAIASNCTTLEHLDIGGNGHFDPDQLTHMLCQLPLLRWLDVACAGFRRPHWKAIFDRCTLLEHINISFTNFSEEVMMYMGEKCPRITSVVMHFEGDDFKVAALAAALPGLEELYLNDSVDLTPIGVILLAGQCKHLRKLQLSHVGCVTDEAIAALALNCPDLVDLDFSYAGRGVTDASLIMLAQTCTKLQSIVLPLSHTVTDVSIIALALNCPQLHKVSVLCGTNVTDAGIIALSTHCALLKYLTLSCDGLTDMALCSLATHLPRLWELTLRECEKITSAGVIALAKRCVSLSSLVITKCIQIDNAGAIAVVQHCRRLRALELSDLPAITNKFADAYRSLKCRAKLTVARTGITAKKLLRLEKYLSGA